MNCNSCRIVGLREEKVLIFWTIYGVNVVDITEERNWNIGRAKPETNIK
jgi:hypothetical protein